MTVVVDSGDGYFRGEATTLIFRYVDDLEILIDADAGKIHLRSAAHAGYSDLGLNRKRVQAPAEASLLPHLVAQGREILGALVRTF